MPKLMRLPLWETCPPEDVESRFQLYVWSEIEKLVYGSLAYSPTNPRPWEEEERISAIVDGLSAAPDVRGAFRAWVVEASARGDVAV